MESAALAYISRIDALGGAVAAIECGFMQDEIERAAYGYAKAVESGSEIVVWQSTASSSRKPRNRRCSRSTRLSSVGRSSA